MKIMQYVPHNLNFLSGFNPRNEQDRIHSENDLLKVVCFMNLLRNSKEEQKAREGAKRD